MIYRIRISGYKKFFLGMILNAGFLLLPGLNQSGLGQTKSFTASATFLVPPGVTRINEYLQNKFNAAHGGI